MVNPEEDIHYEVYESREDETETIESFDDIEEALSLLFTLNHCIKDRQFYADKWIGHGLNAQIEDIMEDVQLC